MQNSIVICGMSRTPIGGLLGSLSSLSAPALGAAAIRGVVSGIDAAQTSIDEVIMGCVLPAGQGQAPARQAVLGAGLPEHVGATTINKMCGSGLKAVMMAHDQILAGAAETMIAGGMESMSQAPYLLDRARAGMRMGHGQIQDHMFLDGLEDAYDKGKLMGWFADGAAATYGIGRSAQDEFAIRSLERALKAEQEGLFASEITPIMFEGRGGTTTISTDEQPAKARPDKIPTLKPAFRPDGTVTAANASSISDGAAALMLTTELQAREFGWPILAKIVAHATHVQAPATFSEAPVGAIQKLLARAGWQAADVDLYEINEAFAVVTMIAMQVLSLPPEKVNIHGGACALGHPIGASGARVLVTLIAALRHYGLKKGVASLCIGGGEAVALAVECLI